jgi:hypothetical protein
MTGKIRGSALMYQHVVSNGTYGLVVSPQLGDFS